MKNRRARYELQEPLIALHNGHLYKARDLSLHRSVLVFIVGLSGTYPAQEYIEGLGRTGHAAWPSLMHVLDVEVSAEHLSVILPYEKGEPLVRLIEQHTFDFSEIVELITALGNDLMDVLERRPLDFSLRAENLWLRHDRRLSVIHTWDKGGSQDRPSKELCRLFFQLVTKSAYVPEDNETFLKMLTRTLEQLSIPQACRTSVLQAAVLTMNEQISLGAWIRSLQQSLTYAASPEEEEEHELPAEEEPHREGRRSITILGRRVGLGLGLSLISILVFIGVLALLFETVGQMLAADDRKPAISQSSPPPQEMPAAETAKPPETKKPPAGGEAGSVPVPSLSGLTKEEAEKQALAAGLRYSFFLEPNEQPAGKVFKQDPKPGETVAKGTRITFWVSKGKS